MVGRHRRVGTSTRLQGLKRKAAELSELFDVDVCFIFCGPDDKFFSWPEDGAQLRRVTERYLDAAGDGDGTTMRKKQRKAAQALKMQSSPSGVAGEKAEVFKPQSFSWAVAGEESEALEELSFLSSGAGVEAEVLKKQGYRLWRQPSVRSPSRWYQSSVGHVGSLYLTSVARVPFQIVFVLQYIG